MNRKIGVLLSYVLMVLEVLSTLLLTPFIIKTLGQAEYGVYKLSAAVIVYLMLLDMGMGNAVIRFISKYRSNKDKKNEQKFLGISLLFYVGLAILSLLIGGILIFFFPTIFSKGLSIEEIKLGQTLMAITIINTAITLASSSYVNALIAYERFAVSRGSSILMTIVKIFALYFTVKEGWGSVGIVTVSLVINFLGRGGLVLYAFWVLHLYPTFKNLDIQYLKEIFAYSSLIFIQMIATMLNQTVDQILIGSIVVSSASLIAVYSIGTQIVQYFQSIGSAFTGVLMPGVVRMVERDPSTENISVEMIRLGRIIFLVMGFICSCFLVCGDTFVSLWVGLENSDAYYVALMLMVANTFIIAESIGSQVLWALNKHKEQAYLKFAIVLVNILLTVCLIQWNPILGATCGTFISLVLGDIIVMNLIFKRNLKMDLSFYYVRLLKGILPSLCISILIGLLVKEFLPESWIGFLINILCMTVIYSLCMFLHGMNQSEKKIIFALLKIKK